MTKINVNGQGGLDLTVQLLDMVRASVLAPSSLWEEHPEAAVLAVAWDNMDDQDFGFFEE